MKIVRVNDNLWLDLWTLTQFLRSVPASLPEDLQPQIDCHPQQGPHLLFSGSEAQAIVTALEASEVRPFSSHMLTMAIDTEEPAPDPDTPLPPTMADVAEEILAMLRKQAADRAAESRMKAEESGLNVIQRFRRFIFGAGAAVVLALSLTGCKPPVPWAHHCRACGIQVEVGKPKDPGYKPICVRCWSRGEE